MRAAFLVACFPLVLTGCALGPTTTDTSPSPGIAIQGRVHGGNLPIVGAHVYLFAANTTGYGAASVSLLNSVPGQTTLDTSGGATNGDYYVTTGAEGSFSITGDYSCTENTQVYLYALGGNPGLLPSTINNAGSGLLAVLGNCPTPGGLNAFLSSVPFVTMDEVSTVAAAYAFAGFATDATHVSSSGTALAQTGIQNAFANAANLADLGSGTAISTPTNNAYNSAPNLAVNTLADILAACVNTDGTVSALPNPTPCYTLFTTATSNGASNGTQPTDTATAAINIAHNPGSNVTALFNLASQTPPFVGLPSQPNDFTLGLQLTTQDMSSPHSLAIDAAGAVWVANSGVSSVDKFTSAGAVQSGTSGFTGGGLFLPDGIAVDSNGDAWATNFSFGNVTEFSNSGTPMTGSPYSVGGAGYGPYGIAIDGTGNVWVTNFYGNGVSELNSSGTLRALYNSTSGLNLSSPRGIAIDGSGNVWIASTANSFVAELSNSGNLLSGGTGAGGINTPYSVAIDAGGNAWIPNYGGVSNTTVSELSSSRSPVTGSPFTESGVYDPIAVALDGAGNAWIADYANNGVTEFSNSGTMVSPSSGYTAGGTINTPVSIAVDGAGNVWIANSNISTLTELIGAATPVVTPLAVGVHNNTLGTQP